MERNIDQINVIPLVDVMLVLLVIVLTTATFISTGTNSRQPGQGQGGGRSDRMFPIVISLTADGSLFLNDSPVPDGGLPSVLSAQPS